MSSNKINTKTIARIAAIQTLYQYESENREQAIPFLIQRMVDFYSSEEINSDFGRDSGKPLKIRPSISYFTALVKTTIDNLDKIDELIAAHLTDEWLITTLPILLLATLRVAVGELLFFPETPHKVIINEFTDITSDMLNDNEVGFVNSLLDKISKKE